MTRQNRHSRSVTSRSTSVSMWVIELSGRKVPRYSARPLIMCTGSKIVVASLFASRNVEPPTDDRPPRLVRVGGPIEAAVRLQYHARQQHGVAPREVSPELPGATGEAVVDLAQHVADRAVEFEHAGQDLLTVALGTHRETGGDGAGASVEGEVVLLEAPARLVVVRVAGDCAVRLQGDSGGDDVAVAAAELPWHQGIRPRGEIAGGRLTRAGVVAQGDDATAVVRKRDGDLGTGGRDHPRIPHPDPRHRPRVVMVEPAVVAEQDRSAVQRDPAGRRLGPRHNADAHVEIDGHPVLRHPGLRDVAVAAGGARDVGSVHLHPRSRRPLRDAQSQREPARVLGSTPIVITPSPVGYWVCWVRVSQVPSGASTDVVDGP